MEEQVTPQLLTANKQSHLYAVSMGKRVILLTDVPQKLNRKAKTAPRTRDLVNDGNQKNLQLEVNMCNLAVSLSEWSTERWWWCTKEQR